MISTNQFKNGLFIKLNNDIFVIMEWQHYKPGKGGAFVRTRLRNIRTTNVLDKTFRSGETVEDIFVEEKKYQYLYSSEGQYHFMDNENYEQIVLTEEKVSDVKKFLKENIEVDVSVHEGNVLSIKLPIFIEMKVAETEPGIKGDTAKSGTKSAKLETGATVQVPLFINIGDTIKIDTRSGEYTGRA